MTRGEGWLRLEWLRDGKKPQVPPLRFAPVGMTILFRGQLLFRCIYPGLYGIVIPTGADPDFLHRDASNDTYAVSRKGSRMKMINATGLDRKSGGAQWRDLRFLPRQRGYHRPLQNLIWTSLNVSRPFETLGTFSGAWPETPLFLRVAILQLRH
jgi:hypothetical protein